MTDESNGEENAYQIVGAISAILGACLLIIFSIWSTLIMGEYLAKEIGILGTIGVFGLAFGIMGTFLFDFGNKKLKKKKRMERSKKAKKKVKQAGKE